MYSQTKKRNNNLSSGSSLIIPQNPGISRSQERLNIKTKNFKNFKNLNQQNKGILSQNIKINKNLKIMQKKLFNS